MRKQALLKVYELAKKNHDIIFIGSDLGIGTLENFKAEMPEQFFMEGVSEAHILTMSAGMASQGRIVFINSIASFLLRRSFEQFYLDICCENKHVIILGSGGGGVYAPLGHTHTIYDDFAITHNFPNLTTFAPCDPVQMELAIEYATFNPGPYYIRFGKGNEPNITNDNTSQNFNTNHGLKLQSDSSLLFITTGITAHIALEVQKLLESNSILSHIYQLNKVKPFPEKEIESLIDNYQHIVIIEEHLEFGGIGSIIKLLSYRKVLHFHLGRNLISHYGRQNDILENQGIDVQSIFKSCIHLFQKE